MAKKESATSRLIKERRVKKVTSIGKSSRTRVNSKAGKRSFKKYRGQGK